MDVSSASCFDTELPCCSTKNNDLLLIRTDKEIVSHVPVDPPSWCIFKPRSYRQVHLDFPNTTRLRWLTTLTPYFVCRIVSADNFDERDWTSFEQYELPRSACLLRLVDHSRPPLLIVRHFYVVTVTPVVAVPQKQPCRIKQWIPSEYKTKKEEILISAAVSAFE